MLMESVFSLYCPLFLYTCFHSDSFLVASQLYICQDPVGIVCGFQVVYIGVIAKVLLSLFSIITKGLWSVMALTSLVENIVFPMLLFLQHFSPFFLHLVGLKISWVRASHCQVYHLVHRLFCLLPEVV